MKNRRFACGLSGRSRRCRRRPFRIRLLIVCEGRETERNYFDQLKREDWARQHFAVTVRRGKGGSRQQVAQFAIDRKDHSGEAYDEVWCVMDVEDPSQRELLESALTMLGQHSILPCLSNPAFEVWLLSHFVRIARVFMDCDDVITHLNKHWQRRFGFDYDKADRYIFARLAEFVADAIENARWVRETHHALAHATADCNSSTEVYRLVGKLLGK
jgi:hypothetical protein